MIALSGSIAALNIVLNLALIPLYGDEGAAAAMVALGLLIGAVAPTARTAGAAGTVLFFPLMYFAGLWTPQLSATARHIGQFTPLGAAVRALRDSMGGAWPHPATLGVLGVTGNQVLFIVGLSMTSVAHGAVISAAAPLMVLLGATLMGLERFTAPKAAGMLVAAAGVAVLQLGRHQTGATMAGDLIMLASQVVFAGFTVLSKRVAAQFGTITLNAFAFICGGLVLLPYAVWEMSRLELVRVSPAAWMGIVYMALFPSIAGYLIYTYALRYLPASRVSSTSYLLPVVAPLFAVLFLGERPGMAFAGGAALVMGGVYTAERR